MKDSKENIFTLVEVTDPRMHYGIITCGNKNITKEQLQDKINEIKYTICQEEENDEWSIMDVISRIPAEWKVSFMSDKGEKLFI